VSHLLLGGHEETDPRRSSEALMSAEPTSLMFVVGSQPLAGARVRLAGDPGRAWVTDDEGRIEATLGRGVHRFEVASEGGWVDHEVDTSSRSSLLVVHVSGRPTPASVARTTEGGFLAAQIEAMGERYVFERMLGRGGMGVVVKARDTVLERAVAMKALSEELRDNAEAQRVFLSEARALATLRHPNLVAVHDVTSISGIALMVFEFVDGENLERRVGKGIRLTERELVDVARQLAQALEYLHGRGVIHRDLKPANLILKPSGELKVIDFGLARSLEDIYAKGTRVRGTPAYMSPEQIQGADLSPASDLYQFGITLYELATGELPFPAGDMGYAHVHMTPPPVSERAPDLHPDLAALIDRCLAKSPEDRPAAATDILALLEHIEWALRAPEPLTQEQLARVTGAQSALGEAHAGRLSGGHAAAPRPGRSKAPLVAALVALALVAVGAAAFFAGPGADDAQRAPGDALEVAAGTTAAAALPEGAPPETAPPEIAPPEVVVPDEPAVEPEAEPVAPPEPAVEDEPAPADAAEAPAAVEAEPTPKPSARPRKRTKPAARPAPTPEPEPEPPAPDPPAPEVKAPAPPVVKKLEPVVVEEKLVEEKPAEKKPVEKKPVKKVIPRSF
jgi:serine/threonine-protein kinase